MSALGRPNSRPSPCPVYSTSGSHLRLPGAFTRAQAGELAAQFRFGALPADFRITGISAFSAASASSQAASG